MSNLISRSIIGVFLFSLIGYLSIYHPTISAILFSITIIVAACELIPRLYRSKRAIYTRVALISLLDFLALNIYIKLHPLEYQYYTISITGIYLVALYLFSQFTRGKIEKDELRYDPFLAFYFLFLGNLLVIEVLYLNILFIQLLFTVVCFDSFAFLAGRFFGKHYPFPSLSMKSIEGYIGGLIITLLICNYMSHHTIFSIRYSFSIALIVLITLLAALGDLLESSVKRSLGVKDSSKILLSHGGVMDRIDSLLLSSIALYIYDMSRLIF
jgi:phosphatidate cytidylyltransferase